MSPGILGSALARGAQPQGRTGPPAAGKMGVQLSAGSSAMDLGQICAKVLQQLSFHCPFLSIILPSATSLPRRLGTWSMSINPLVLPPGSGASCAPTLDLGDN